MNNGEIKKLKLTGYLDNKFSKEIGDYELPINPESIDRSFTISNQESQSSGTSANDLIYNKTKPEVIKMDFVIDRTGAIIEKSDVKNAKKLTVEGEVALFLDVVYKLKGDSHVPSFLKINWGENLIFDCKLTSLSIKYTLFNSSGSALRAKINASFTGYWEAEKRVRAEAKSSPDLSHIKQVQGGDTLPLMAYQIYGDDNYFMQVAKANELTSFRSIRAGQNLIFPPIEKSLS